MNLPDDVALEIISSEKLILESALRVIAEAVGVSPDDPVDDVIAAVKKMACDFAALLIREEELLELTDNYIGDTLAARIRGMQKCLNTNAAENERLRKVRHE
jgi:hypothetical protein